MKLHTLCRYTLAAMITLIPINAYGAQGWVLSDDSYRYEQEDGTWCASQWKEIAGEWYYFDESGVMRTGWLMDGSVSYYLDPDTGAMVRDTTRTVDGVLCRFDRSGVYSAASSVVLAQEKSEWHNLTYRSMVGNYTITLPEDYMTYGPETLGWGEDGGIEALGEKLDGNLTVGIDCKPAEEGDTAESMAQDLSALLSGGFMGGNNEISQGIINQGGSDYGYVKWNMQGIHVDLYAKREGAYFVLITVMYHQSLEAEANQIFSTVHNIW